MNRKALMLGAALGFLLALAPSCGGGDECGADSCPTGCCDSGGACVTATTALKCGTGGQTCGACGVDQICQAGACVAGNPDGGSSGACSLATNPNGCCSELGTSFPGTDDTACGTRGTTCTDCTLSGTRCLDPDGTGPQLRSCREGDGGVPAGVVGSACTSPSQCTGVPVSNAANRMCKTGTTFGNLTYPDGYCTRRCFDNSHCGSGGLCAIGLGEFGEADNICLDRCSSSAECRAGYGCINFGSASAPVGACWVLPPSDAGYATVDAGPGANENVMGGACTADTQCQPPADGFCVPQTLSNGTPTGYTDGACTADCTYGGDKYCGTSGICVLYPYDPTQTGTINSELLQFVGFCEAECSTASSTCRNGYYCAALSNTTSVGFCSPRCNVPGALPCPSGRTCNTTNGMCCNATNCI